MWNKTYNFCVILLFLTLTSFSQENWNNYVTYTDLKEASKEKDLVEKLVLKRNKYKTFPEEIKNFKNLVYLDLSKNKLETVPDWIKDLPKLKYLKLMKNKLTSFNKNICELSELVFLDLGNNVIENIPKEIAKLDKLIELRLWSNEIDYFPDELEEMESLKVLNLKAMLINRDDQNRLKTLLPEVKIYMDSPCNCGG